MIGAGLERAAREALSLEECARRVVTETRARGPARRRVRHRVHTHDPRTPVLFDLARRNGLAGDGIRFMEALEQAVAAQVKPLTINIDGALAAVLHDMGFPPPFGRLVFIIGRVAGLTAEVTEELARERPMRIRIPVTYDGEPPRTSTDPCAHRRTGAGSSPRHGRHCHDDQLPRSHRAGHRGAAPDEGTGAERRRPGDRLLGVLLELRAAADSGRCVPRSIRDAVTYSLALTLWSASRR